VEWDQYAVAWAEQHGGYDPRRAPGLARGGMRLSYRIARGLAALRVRPATVTVLGLALAAAVPAVVGRHPAGPLVAAGLVLLSSLAGPLDRALAVLSAHGAPAAVIGATVAARLAEVAWLVGFWRLGVPGLLVLAAGLLTAVQEQVRGQAIAAGMSPIGAQTVAERSMRVLVAAGGLALAGLVGLVERQLAAGVLTLAATAWLLATVLGLSQLAGALRRSLR
jgi:CDP-diacylglycerol--glycerol-3-phosphate 3-phosphatidyltransferase